MSGLDEMGLEAARAAFYGPKGSVVAAIRAYLAAATPADVGELVKRLRSAGCHYGIPIERDCAEAATALERVVRERDEAHLRTAYLEEEVVRTRDAAVERVRTAEAKLAEALADRAAQAERMARLEEALRDIRDGRGKCKTCGTPATGGGAGFTDCDCARPSWTPQDPADIAARALSQEGS